MSLLEIDGLVVGTDSSEILKGVSLEARVGRTTGVVGESGSGKSMTALAVLGLLPPGVSATAGSIRFDGTDVLHLAARERRLLRGKQVAMVFQDPLAALNPVMRIDDQIGEILRRRAGLSRRHARQQAVELLHRVEVPEPEHRAASYPHQLSGGQRQRVVIAMALAGKPRLILADEPTTALDVTVQARILELLRRLQREEDLSILLISHDLRVMAHFADDLVVMQHGVVVETGAAADVLRDPQASYTRNLIDNVPAVHA
jgi:ABC-type glutathione transport system ATPase component